MSTSLRMGEVEYLINGEWVSTTGPSILTYTTNCISLEFYTNGHTDGWHFPTRMKINNYPSEEREFDVMSWKRDSQYFSDTDRWVLEIKNLRTKSLDHFCGEFDFEIEKR